jgi:hypothetical protein
MQYVERCQSFLQWGEPDNDFLVYLPVRDMWQKQTDKLLMQFSIHKMGQLAPEFIETILAIDRAGFDCDYISDRLLMGTTFRDGMLQTAAGTRYKGLVIPECRMMPEAVKTHIAQLKAQGAHIIIGTRATDLQQAARPEAIKTACGLKAIRRRNATGYHYFIANLTPNDIDDRLPLAVAFKSATWFNPLNGDITPACVSGDSIDIRLRSGESMILQTYDSGESATAIPSGKRAAANSKFYTLNSKILSGPWTLSFIEEAPRSTRPSPSTLPRLGRRSTTTV